MITVSIRKQGGAAIITIPSDLLKLLNVEMGEELAMNIEKGALVARPMHKKMQKRYSLKELLHAKNSGRDEGGNQRAT